MSEEGIDDPRSVLSLAANELGAGQFEEALARVKALQPSLAGTPDLLAPSRALEARALASLGREEEALVVLEQAQKDAEAANLPAHVEGLGRLRAGLAQAFEMERLASMSPEDLERQTEDPAQRAVLYSNKIVAALAVGDVEGARELLPRARAAAEQAEDPAALLPVLLATTQLCVATNDVPTAKRALEAARKVAEASEPDAIPLIDEMAGYLLRDPEA
ncbi:hypothetical protein [Polyangium sorediatum]|uniref:Tetratricopeptide repeat protein n=1 Tax=Polyangium sorediatum TaxID=889274 RepID=A0ABT6NUY4_9BACT|nr:hypothetical protein [Polyangium sorediatum]MDI1431957.1 hypothetical protein [Polyangium sorediatum]